MLNTDTSPQNFWTTFLENDLTEEFKKSTVASAIAIPLPLCFSCFDPLHRFRQNLTKPFYFYLSRTCDSPSGTPSVITLALTNFTRYRPVFFELWAQCIMLHQCRIVRYYAHQKHTFQGVGMYKKWFYFIILYSFMKLGNYAPAQFSHP